MEVLTHCRVKAYTEPSKYRLYSILSPSSSFRKRFVTSQLYFVSIRSVPTAQTERLNRAINLHAMSPTTAGNKATMKRSNDRAALTGVEKRLFNVVAKRATSAQWAEWLRLPLEHAMADGNKDLVSSLLKAGADGSAGWEGCDGRRLLDAAAAGGSEEVVSNLLKTGSSTDLNVVSGDNRRTALHRASKGGHTAAARVLMLAGADANLLDTRNRSALHYAIEGGHLKLAADLVIAGADHNAPDTDGNTPLHLAAARGGDTLVCALLHRGAGVEIANNKGQYPLHKAVENKCITVVEALLEAGSDPNIRYGLANQSPLELAFSSLAMTQTLLKHGADVKSRDGFGIAALHWAAEGGKSSVIHALVEAGTDLETQSGEFGIELDCGVDVHRARPLHHAASACNSKGMVALLRMGANVNSTDDQALTPLHIACISGGAQSVEAADLLLRWGADETIIDNDAHTPAGLRKLVIDNDAGNSTGRLQRLLTNAPADRAWRRRGMLVLGRGRSASLAGGAGAESTSDCIISRLLGLEAHFLFRTIVRFL